ncbi:MAG: hypothetical protein KJ571_11850 [Bacteroidetes bacterium]|nr:hypothetical protein [Bacteroidota bacterium]
MKTSKIIATTFFVILFAVMYFNYFAPSDKVGSFSKFSPGSEINQVINVEVVKAKGFERDGIGNIISFYVKDKDDIEVQVSLHEPAPADIINAEVIEVLGHMHGNTLTASRVTVLK